MRSFILLLSCKVPVENKTGSLHNTRKKARRKEEIEQKVEEAILANMWNSQDS